MAGTSQGLRRLIALLALALHGAASAGGVGLHALGGHDHEPAACDGPAAPHLDADHEPGGDCPVCHHLAMSQACGLRAEAPPIDRATRPVRLVRPVAPPPAATSPRPPLRAPPLG